MSLLSADELYEMTGYKRGKDQARWFRDHGYYVECNARGVPRITHEQVEARRRAMPTQMSVADTRPRTEPNVLEFRNKLNLSR